MKKVFLISMLWISFGVFAVSTPKGSNFDSRMQSISFNSKDVIGVNVADGFVSSIRFSDTETILDVITGFNNGYEFKDNSNILYIKPKSLIIDNAEIQPYELWNTNLLVTTNKRVYAFDLNIVDTNSKSISYLVNINYPDDVLNQKKEAIETDKQNKIKNKLNEWKTPINWDYAMKVGENSQTIKPVFSYDDGQFTYLGFTKNSSFPSVYLYENGVETILNTHIKYDDNYQILVIQRLAEVFVLRSGERVVAVYNLSNLDSGNTYNTTSSNSVQRVLNK